MDVPPETKQIEQKLNSIVSKELQNVHFKADRDYIIGKRSAGFRIYDGETEISKMDLSMNNATPSSRYYYAEASFTGYALENIIADKVSVLSGNKIFRRTKDFIDIYSLLITLDIEKKIIIETAKKKGRSFEDFDAFINRKNDLEHSYGLMKGIENKPDFDSVYDLVYRFVEGIRSDDTDIKWNHLESKWIKNEVQ